MHVTSILSSSPSLRRGILLVGLATMLGACGGSSGGDDSAGDDADFGDEILSDYGIDASADGSDDAEAAEEPTGASDDEVAGATGAGGGSIIVGGEAFIFEGDLCFAEDSFFQVSGSGLRAADGLPFYGDISINTNEDYDGDGTLDTAATVALEFGTDDAFGGGADDEPSYEATVLLAGDLLTTEEFTWEFRGDSEVFGSGEITDFNGVGTEYGEYVSLDFSAACV